MEKEKETYIHQKIDLLDEIISQCMLDAEKECGKSYNHVPFSDTIMKTRLLIRYWKIVSAHKSSTLEKRQMTKLNPLHDEKKHTHRKRNKTKNNSYKKENIRTN